LLSVVFVAAVYDRRSALIERRYSELYTTATAKVDGGLSKCDDGVLN
jgi:hypothetical protein